MLFYNFFIWLKFHSRAYLAYVCYIFSYLLFAAIYHGIVQQYVFPQLENGWLFQNFVFVVIEVTCITASTFSIEFLSLKQSTPRLYRLVNGLRIFFILNLLNWMTFGYEAKRITMIDTFLTSVVLISIGFYRSFSYRPARFYTVGWTLFLTGNLFMLLGSNGVINSTVIGPWSQFTGAVLELVLLSLALGDRVALINAERRKLHASLIESEREKIEERESHIRELDRLVFERTREVKSILATINQGIFTIGIRDRRLQVVSEYSQFLTTMLGTEDIRGRDPIQLLFSRSQLATEAIDQIRQILFMSLGEDRAGYQINSVHLVRDIVLNDAMFVEIDWLPILNADETVDHVLVILRDMTQMRKLREQARIQEHELLMMGELTTGPGRRFPLFQQKFLDQLQPFLAASLEKAQAPLNPPDRQRSAIFLHSMKGDARVFGLRSLSQAVHDAESALQGAAIQTHEQLAALLQSLLQVLRYYENIRKERLHFAEDKEPIASPGDLQAVLRDHLQSLRKTAIESGKPVPEFIFQGTAGMLPPELHNGISQAFGHILTNTLDHGLEVGGPAAIILFTQKVQQGVLEIEYSDNGRGLDIGSLRDKGVGLSPEAAAETIFQAGLSTARQVSLTSGRGIGMTAVRELLERMGGHIRIRLGAEKPGRPGFHAFTFVIRIPLGGEQRRAS